MPDRLKDIETICRVGDAESPILHNFMFEKETHKMKEGSYENREYEELCRKALLRMGNHSRIVYHIGRVLQNEKITVAYIGGSITQGVGAKKPWKDCYAYQSFLGFRNALERKFELTKEQLKNICFLKAGLAGTGSELGSVRYEADVERDGKEMPDIVIVEFCVNDEEDETKGVFYESLVRRILGQKNCPAAILLFSVFQDGFNLQKRLFPIGERYDLPVISIKDGIYGQFGREKEIISSDAFYADPLHPSEIGHRFMADCLCYYWSRLLENVDLSRSQQIGVGEGSSAQVEEIQPVYGKGMVAMRLLDRNHSYEGAQIQEGDFNGTDQDLQCAPMDDGPEEIPAFPYNWHFKGTGSDLRPFCMNIHAASLVVVLKDSDKEEFGVVHIHVDGKPCRIFDPHVDNWTHCHVLLLYKDCPGLHKVEIFPQPGETEKKATILGFGYVP